MKRQGTEKTSRRDKLKISVVITSIIMVLTIFLILIFWNYVLSQYKTDKACVSASNTISNENLNVVSISDNSIELGKGISYQLKSSSANVVWKSSNEEIARVDENGLVKGVNVGECVVTAADNQGDSAQCNVRVKKTCYLTFDDGPNENTVDILGVLKEHNVKATFFVVSSKYLNLTKQMQEQGCLVGMHTYNHDYKKCYKTYYSYYYGLEKLSKKIESFTGTQPDIIRFPGGTSNTSSDPLLMK